MLFTILVLAVSTVVSAAVNGCEDCSNTPVKCVGVGKFCVTDDEAYDPFNPCPGNLMANGWSSCPVCKGPNLICHENTCKERTQQKGDQCCESTLDDCGDLQWCEEWLVCTDRDGIGLRCVPRAETGLNNGQGNFGQADGECETVEDGYACGGSNLVCQGAKCLFSAAQAGVDLAGGGSNDQDHCMEDGDCPPGQYCPEQQNLTHAFMCLDNYQTLEEKNILGMECESDLHCGTNFVCRVENPMDPTDITPVCRKRWSRKLNEPCQDPLFDCARGLFCDAKFQGVNFGYGVCSPDPPCLGAKIETFQNCRRHTNDALDSDCFDRGLSYSLGKEHCTYSGAASGINLRSAEQFSSYIGPMEKFYKCLGTKGCQIFQDGTASGLQRTIYSSCSRDNCLSILNSVFRAYDPVMGKYNSTCSKFASPGGITGTSSGVVFAPRALVVAAGIVMALLF